MKVSAVIAALSVATGVLAAPAGAPGPQTNGFISRAALVTPASSNSSVNDTTAAPSTAAAFVDSPPVPISDATFAAPTGNSTVVPTSPVSLVASTSGDSPALPTSDLSFPEPTFSDSPPAINSVRRVDLEGAGQAGAAHPPPPGYPASGPYPGSPGPYPGPPGPLPGPPALYYPPGPYYFGGYPSYYYYTYPAYTYQYTYPISA